MAVGTSSRQRPPDPQPQLFKTSDVSATGTSGWCERATDPARLSPPASDSCRVRRGGKQTLPPSRGGGGAGERGSGRSFQGGAGSKSAQRRLRREAEGGPAFRVPAVGPRPAQLPTARRAVSAQPRVLLHRTPESAPADGSVFPGRPPRRGLPALSALWVCLGVRPPNVPSPTRPGAQPGRTASREDGPARPVTRLPERGQKRDLATVAVDRLGVFPRAGRGRPTQLRVQRPGVCRPCPAEVTAQRPSHAPPTHRLRKPR